MIEKRIQLAEGAPLTLIEVAGDLLIETWDEADVLVQMQGEREKDLVVQDGEAGPTISARAACSVRVPASARVTVRDARESLKLAGLSDLSADQVRGSVKASDVEQATFAEVYGNLKADGFTSLRVTQTVYGNASLSDGENADLQNVHGNLSVKALDTVQALRVGGNFYLSQVDGPVTVESVGGNSVLKGVGGVLNLAKVGGNLATSGLVAGAKVAKVGGNMVLNGEIGAGCTYHFKAGGNAVLRLPEGTGAHLTLSAKGKVRSALPLSGEEQQGTTVTGTLGEGGAEIVVEAGGNVLVGGTAQSLGADLGAEISRQVEEALQSIDLAAVGEQISAEMDRAMVQLRDKLETVDWDRIGRRTQRSMERAMQRLQRDIDRLSEKAARRQEKLERMAQRAAREQEKWERAGQRMAGEGQGRAAGIYFAGSTGSDEPTADLDQERLAILKMLEEGKISAQEAETLLDALE